MATSKDFEAFVDRHIGPRQHEIEVMLKTVEAGSLEELIEQTVPRSIRSEGVIDLGPGLTEAEILKEARRIASKNQVYRSFIGQGYANCTVPPVILRNVLENPGWYTQYTPYQAEIAQGRLEALLNFQTMISDLTGLPIANASLLDEGTAAAEAMALADAARKRGQGRRFFVSELCHPQTIDVLKTRARYMGIEVEVGDHVAFRANSDFFAALLQYPSSRGQVLDYTEWARGVKSHDLLVIAACDLLSLLLLKPPGEWGADVAVGNSQRFGVPLGFGGPHAAFFAVGEAFKRRIPGRLVGVSQDADGHPALRLALQTREQHIRRDKATSNICTAQVLLAIMAGMYAVYHGPRGLKRIAQRVHRYTGVLARELTTQGFPPRAATFFDTLRIDLDASLKAEILARAEKARMNFRLYPDGLGLTLDETVTEEELQHIAAVFLGHPVSLAGHEPTSGIPASLRRQGECLRHPVFRSHRSETEMLRYLKRLESKDLSLAHSMIALGSCTMKLNATAEMIPVTWPEFSDIHPLAPLSQAQGYLELIEELERLLCEATGFAAFSLQPNAGAQGEYAGLIAIRGFHESRGQGHRDVCLIPQSAHGTNPASAVMAGLRVVVVRCDGEGNIDPVDLAAKADKHRDQLAALMITYPSTHGVFEEGIGDIIRVIHRAGGQVYLDGANLNAQLGICRPGDYGADVCHLNLHKTFCIPHGGGGPGVGPIGVAEHLRPFLPSHRSAPVGGERSPGPVAAAPWGSAGILPISWAYIKLMGSEGMRRATQVAILNANYVAKRLEGHYDVLYKGRNGRVAHECILDLRQFRRSSGIEVNDVAKRLMDFGFHAPTVSWPVVETMMVEPTESESKAELDRFCDAMIAIRREIAETEGGVPAGSSPLRQAPHTARMLAEDEWPHAYSRRRAAYPAPWLEEHKFWPPVRRIDNVYGDRNLFCVCPPIEDFEE